MLVAFKSEDKGKVLAALYNGSQPLGMGFMHFTPSPMGENEANEILETQTYFDYLNGRVLKVNLSSDQFDTRLYDRDNGEGAAIHALALNGVDCWEAKE